MSVDKAALRERFKAYRRSLDEHAYDSLSSKIVDRAIRIPEIVSATVVHVYWPIVDRREVDTRPLIQWLVENEKEIVLPVMTGLDGGTTNASKSTGESRLQHVRFTGEEGLRRNHWGVAEPVERHKVALEDVEVVLVPALGADRRGHRIGYGYGYYDEFLARTPARKIALLYGECLVDCVPSETFDVPMDVLVTEKEVTTPDR